MIIRGPFLIPELSCDLVNLFTLFKEVFDHDLEPNWKDVK